LSDIHGQYDLFINLLKAQRIIDDNENWNWEDGHLVINGDIFDRGPMVTETLWFLYKLEEQAVTAGGNVHVILGNHELMVLRGDLRYLHEKYEYICEKTGISYDKLFSKNSVLGTWLRTKPVTVKINDFIFVHAGFHPDFLKYGFDIEKLNDIFRNNIDNNTENIKSDEKLSFLFRGNGPVWYRGYFSESSSDELQIDAFLKDFDVEKIVVGHTSMEKISSFHMSKVIAVDSSMKYGENGEILLWEDDQLFRGTLSGEKLPLE